MAATFLSFFSGALGLDLGLRRAGFRCLAASEWDRAACATIRANEPDVRLYSGDVRELTAGHLRSDLGIGREGPDAVVGGPPCQAFSTAGRRRSLSDERGSVASHFLQLAVDLRPRWIVLENVRGLLSAALRHRPLDQRGPASPPLTAEELPGGAMRALIRFLEDHGYGVSFRLYDAARFGVPQRRERLILIATRDGVVWPHLTPTHAPDRATTFREATAGLRSREWLPLRPHQRRYLGSIGAGQNWRSLPSELQPEALGGAFRSSGGRVGFLRRVAWDEPAPTLVTNPTMPATLLAHPEEARPLSVEEYGRLQGFPDDWVVVGNTAAKYRQLGNAVPVGLGEALGRCLLDPSPIRPDSTSRYAFDCQDTWPHRFQRVR